MGLFKISKTDTTQTEFKGGFRELLKVQEENRRNLQKLELNAKIQNALKNGNIAEADSLMNIQQIQKDYEETLAALKTQPQMQEPKFDLD